jgi:hypothetical protein
MKVAAGELDSVDDIAAILETASQPRQCNPMNAGE